MLVILSSPDGGHSVLFSHFVVGWGAAASALCPPVVLLLAAALPLLLRGGLSTMLSDVLLWHPEYFCSYVAWEDSWRAVVQGGP
jgi:hypothetical protein